MSLNGPGGEMNNGSALGHITFLSFKTGGCVANVRRPLTSARHFSSIVKSNKVSIWDHEVNITLHFI